MNAKNHENEGEIIAQAGRLGAVTIATNMAGRGIDIKLGGNPLVEEEYQKVIDNYSNSNLYDSASNAIRRIEDRQ